MVIPAVLYSGQDHQEVAPSALPSHRAHNQRPDSGDPRSRVLPADQLLLLLDEDDVVVPNLEVVHVAGKPDVPDSKRALVRDREEGGECIVVLELDSWSDRHVAPEDKKCEDGRSTDRGAPHPAAYPSNAPPPASFRSRLLVRDGLVPLFWTIGVT